MRFRPMALMLCACVMLSCAPVGNPESFWFGETGVSAETAVSSGHSAVSNEIACCSDGVVNAPLPEHESYLFYREPESAVYIGGAAESCIALIVPPTIYGYPVTAVEESVLAGFSQLSTVILGENVETIGDEAFLNCQSLTKIVIPPSVTEIGAYAVGFWKNSDGSYSKMSKTVIYCTEGSAAHAYALDAGLAYVVMTEEELVSSLGDVNLDGTVSIADAVVLQKGLVAASILTVEGASRADLCDDGVLNGFDLVALKKKLAATDASAEDSTEQMAAELIRLVNEVRAEYGLAALSQSELLSQAAQIRAEEIAVVFDHVRPDGRECFTVLDDLGISCWSCGENIALGQKTPQEVLSAWMTSEGHRGNILSSDFDSIGIGYDPDTKAWVQIFIGF